MSILNIATIESYFSHLASAYTSHKEVYALVVAHMVPNSLAFIPALSRIVSIGAVLPKPKSVANPEYRLIAEKFPIIELSREWASDASAVCRDFASRVPDGARFLIVDIGGYFEETVDKISDQFPGRLIGVLEGTENGLRRYLNSPPTKVPLISVARSPLKLPEDYLVGSSIVFSIEAVLREESEILQTRSAAVLGYGRVGSAIADILRGRGLNTVVYDDDPVQLSKAAARGFHAHRRVEDALSVSTLVICATGNKSLDLKRFAMLRTGAVVASVTSADDELDLSSLARGYFRSDISAHLTKFEENRGSGRYFLLINGGNAANFVHGAVIGPAIQLIEGEKIAAISALLENNFSPGQQSYEVTAAQRRKVAEIWNEHFLP